MRLYSIVIIVLIVILGCSKEEEFTIISPANISFVHEDGSEISINECIRPSGKYAVKIRTTAEGNGKYKVINIDYAVNGSLYSMTFLSEGSQIIPVNLIDGKNTAQIAGSSLTSNIYFVAQGDFELVN